MNSIIITAAELVQVPSGVIVTPGDRTEHYAHCRTAACDGCLPSDDDLATWDLRPLWGEMLARGIAQTTYTKTVSGAFRALVEDGDEYRSHNGVVRSVAPARWTALEGPCDTCRRGDDQLHDYRCPDCVNGRKKIGLRQAHCKCGPRVHPDPCSDLCDCSCYLDVVARATVEVRTILHVWQSTSGETWMDGPTGTHRLPDLNPLPVPGRDFVLVLNEMEMS